MMKINKLSFVLLNIFAASAFAGNYVDNGSEAIPQNNKDDEHHFYIDVGVNGYYFDQPSMILPLSVGYGNTNGGGSFPSTPGDSYDADNWALNPTLTLGYQFLTDNPEIQEIFGQQNAIELRVSYFHNSGTQDESYDDQPYYVNNFPITGNTMFGNNASFVMTNSHVNFDNTYAAIGLYYTGTKVVNNNFINSPYVGVDFNYLKQNSDYTTLQYIPSYDGQPILDTPLEGEGSDDLTSYYIGFAFGDKATWLFANHYGVYGQLGAGLYWLHTTLDASQTPVTNQPDLDDETLLATYMVNTTDNTPTFKLNAEVGFSYYLKSNQDPSSMRVTLLAGMDYWNDVAYADNPTQEGEAVKIGYESSLNPYAGLQLHVPL